MRRHTPLLLYLGALVWWTLFCAYHTFHIGRMPLPRSQAVALGLTFALGLSLAAAWVALGLRLAARLLARTAGGLFRGASSSEPGKTTDEPLHPLDRRWIRVCLLTLLVLAVGLYLYGRYVEPRSLVVRELSLGRPASRAVSGSRARPALQGRPPAERAVRIAVISDLHMDGRPWTELAATVNRTRPDLILMLGDTLNRRRALPALHQTLRAMRAPGGKFAVQGNWEAWYWHDLPLLEGTGFRWLRGAMTLHLHGVRVHLVGLPYRDGDHGRRAERLLSRLPRPGWRVFLYHTPDMALDVPSADLYLAGHTHGGQISLPFFGALVTLSRYGKRFERGAKRVGRTLVYTNPGIGVEPMIPLRIGVRPEVTLVKLGQP